MLVEEISSPNLYRRRDELWSTKIYSSHIDTTDVLVHCKLTQVHTPRGSRIQFLESFASCHCSERNFDYLLNWLSTRTSGTGRPHVGLCHALLVIVFVLSEFAICFSPCTLLFIELIMCVCLSHFINKPLLQGGPKNSKLSYFVHIFAKYWPIFTIFSQVDSAGNLQLISMHTAPTMLLHYLVKQIPENQQYHTVAGCSFVGYRQFKEIPLSESLIMSQLLTILCS